jgi:hypothetical protein
MADVAEAMKGAFEALTKDIREKLREAQAESGLVEDFMQFAHAVDWTVRILRSAVCSTGAAGVVVCVV